MPNEQTNATYRYNKSLIKGLALLVELNRSPNATCTITELAKNTGQHRTTVKRLLETLKQAGYVQHDIATNLYRLTFRVQQLSYGYRDTTLVAEAAWPHMREFSHKMVWPCSIVAPEGDEMVVRLSTRPYSRLSFHPGMPGRRLPVLTTAAGRAYFAYASAAARETMLTMLRSRHEMQGSPVLSAASIQALIDDTRARGYGSNFGEWSEEPKFGGYAVPIRNPGGEAMVALNVIFLTSAMKVEGARENLLDALLVAAGKIEQGYAQSLETQGDA